MRGLCEPVLFKEGQAERIGGVARSVRFRGDPRLCADGVNSDAVPEKVDLEVRETLKRPESPHYLSASFVKYKSNVLLFVRPAKKSSRFCIVADYVSVHP